MTGHTCTCKVVLLLITKVVLYQNYGTC
eukprot:SAG11_NODE_25173_length_362_cov_1.589354_1_plen_27_part_01